MQFFYKENVSREVFPYWKHDRFYFDDIDETECKSGATALYVRISWYVYVLPRDYLRYYFGKPYSIQVKDHTNKIYNKYINNTKKTYLIN